jgi:molybdopterin synthase catalytic subunit
MTPPRSGCTAPPQGGTAGGLAEPDPQRSLGSPFLAASSSGSRVRIQTEDFDVAREVAALREGDARVGAVASFIGTVRDRSAGQGPADTTRMELEHYPGMTEAAIEAMIDEAMRRFSILGARVVHRVGPLEPGDQIVLVVVTSSHRGEAFKACEFLMDYLKTQAPFWKKEHRPDGSAEWVDARVADDAALARWGLASVNAGAVLPAR